MDELIRKQDALDALMAERKQLLANAQKGAEHILTHHGYNVIDELKPVQSDVPEMNVGDMISKQDATTIPVMPKEHRHYQTNNLDDAYEQGWTDLQECIENMPSVQSNHNAEVSKMVDDAISRQAAMERLMAQNVIMDGSEYHNGFNAGVNRAQEVIRNLPPVQTEIIHCKDCLYKKICSWKNQGAKFCSFGERGKAE